MLSPQVLYGEAIGRMVPLKVTWLQGMGLPVYLLFVSVTVFRRHSLCRPPIPETHTRRRNPQCLYQPFKPWPTTHRMSLQILAEMPPQGYR